MRNIRKFILFICLLSTTSVVFSQDQVEALIFSQKYFQSDARAAGAGNAFGAIGANFISSSINPAGLAFYRSSEFSFSLGFSTLYSKGSYLDEITNHHRYNINVPDLALVFTKLKKSKGMTVKEGWVSTTFAMGINRTNSFSGEKSFQGTNTTSSILYNFVETANGIPSANLSLNNVGCLAWDAFLINPDKKQNMYISALSDSNLSLKQTNSVKTRGNMYDINMSLAGNYSNKFYIGGTVSIPTVNYHETRIFNETNLKPTKDYVSSTYERELNVSGFGIQGMFGVIYKPIKSVRIGGSIQSPALYSMTATYNQKLSSSLYTRPDTTYNFIVDTTAASEGNIDFQFASPFRATVSLGILLDKFGFIGIDYEFVDYSLSYYNSDLYSYTKENNRIENTYGPAHNLKVGGEFKLDIFALRLGYNIYGSPYQTNSKPTKADGSARMLSFGAGVREDDYFLDVSYQILQTKEFVLPYSLKSQNVEGAVQNLKRTNLIFTFGLRF